MREPLDPLPDPEFDDTIEELSDAAVVAHSGSMAVATLVSRVTGFIKLLLITAALGAASASAFSTANQLPNIIAALVLEATFTAIFIPVLTRAEREDPDGGQAFVRKLLTIATTLLLATTVLAVLAAPLLTSLMLGGDPKVSTPLTTALAYLLLPQIFFYGLSSVFMAILNTRNVFGPPAWAPVWNNVVAIVTLVLYWLMPGELTLNPMRMSDPKLLVLGIGTTLGVVTQVIVLVPALRRQGIPLRPLWGIDDRLKQFAGMAAAMVAYVAISDLGFVITNRIAAGAADSGPIIYNQTWMILQLPYGVVGITILTAIMPRLSRNAAAEDTGAVLADMSLATRLTMIVLIPVVAVMTVGGPAMGPALFAYGNFSLASAHYLGLSIALSAFTLIPYALVLLQLRVFYARHEAWTPTLVIIAITTVKIVGSVIAPHLTDDPRLVAGYLGAANGIGWVVGALCGYLLLRRSIGRAAGPLIAPAVVRTVLVTLAASATAAAVGLGIDRGFGLDLLTLRGGGLGSILRLAIIGIVMLCVTCALMVAVKLPEALSVVAILQRRLGGRSGASFQDHASVMGNSPGPSLPYPDSGDRVGGSADGRMTTANKPPHGGDGDTRKDSAVTDTPGSSTRAASAAPHSAGSPSGDTGPTPAMPGARIADGRYRLLTSHGGPDGLQFWQATDTELNRPVALTIIDGAAFTPDQVQDILSNTLRLSKIESAGLARVLDAVREGSGGIVVAQWVRGGSLREVADTEPSAVGASRAVRSLADAADAAFDAGSALSIDHPDRVRISIDGDAVLAFPATMTSASADEDVQGLGAALYALTTRRWPLAETGRPSGLPTASRAPDGRVIAAQVVVPTIPTEISDVASRALSDDPGSAADLLDGLESAIASVDHTTMLEPAATASTQALNVGRPRTFEESAAAENDEDPEDLDDDPEEQARHRKVFLIGLGVVGILVIALCIALGVWVTRIFGDVGPLDKINIGIGLPTQSSGSSSDSGNTVKVVKATVFSPKEAADRPDDAGLAVDGNPSTSWGTDVYFDADPFPAFKPGVGLILDLQSPTALKSVTIESQSVGTQVEIRSSSSSLPGSLNDTTEIASTTTLKPGKTTIPITDSSKVSHVLVWISKLGTTNGKFSAEFNEITLSAAS
ncbi:murein biosynthesis protein MurJ [Mycobacterium sp. CBMA271]|uniref:murein biosynthesis integral membrane protein MurJ n=1 Tax=unclassified Mycobacteroides TaxID=2618759 RepID=UPI0012DE64DE|nr:MULTISPECIES: murein biosynthesis integral membrane protein MurJ [unclassified Mycobacteroides]MUM17096.1 murein biosynthesis protein MurJ [Mycobacteroides sp. CBMA 326]MUM23334.1 murein biosynthesis protein MurJ [Mycobacteroides sp. CBMA 271]